MFKGTGIALITPFNEDGSIDFESLRSLIEYCSKGGVDFLVAMGTTAKAATLTAAERAEVIEKIKEYNTANLPVVLGIGGNNTAEIVRQLQTTNLEGIDGILSVSPYYNKPTQEGIYEHFKAVSLASEKPIILYNVPSRTGSNMLAETTLALANDFDNIVAVKEASGSMNQAMEIIQAKPEDFVVLSGEDNLTVPMMHMEAEGVISVSAQAFPAHFKIIMNSELEEMNKAHYELYHFTNLLFKEGNPAGLKAALKALGVISSAQVRLPLVQASEELQTALKQEIDWIKTQA